MRRLRLPAAWLLLVHAFTGARAADAQARPGVVSEVGQGDSIAVTLSEARELALLRGPAFLADRQAIAAAEGRLRQARVPAPNPEIDFQSRGDPSVGSGAFEASITQELEIAGQRGLRVRAARSGLGRAEAGVRDAARLALLGVSDAFYAASAARERLEVARDLLDLNEQLVGATRIQLAEGEISRLEANLVEVELGRARARVLAESRALRSALGDLERLTDTRGIVPARPDHADLTFRAAADLDVDSLVATALSRRPDLRSAEAALEEATALESLARREAIPSVRVGAVAEREEGVGPGERSSSPRFGLVLRTTLPFWNRNQGVAAEREALAEEARLRRAAVELAVRTDVATAYQGYAAASEELAVFEAEVLEPARANQALLETAFTSGKIGLPTLLLLRNQLLDAQLAYWDTWLARARAHVALDAATGGWEPPAVASGEDR